jgi:hypothetical protein
VYQHKINNTSLCLYSDLSGIYFNWLLYNLCDLLNDYLYKKYTFTAVYYHFLVPHRIVVWPKTWNNEN